VVEVGARKQDGKDVGAGKLKLETTPDHATGSYTVVERKCSKCSKAIKGGIYKRGNEIYCATCFTKLFGSEA